MAFKLFYALHLTILSGCGCFSHLRIYARKIKNKPRQCNRKKWKRSDKEGNKESSWHNSRDGGSKHFFFF